MNTLNKKDGFTIIEVVLVLAIAGLIFLMVFIALPALQSGQRDNARKNDASIVASAVNSYTSGNRGNFPNSTQFASYVQDVSDNTDREQVAIEPRSNRTAVTVSDSQIKVVTGAKCGSTGKKNADGVASQAIDAGTKRQYVTVTLLEAGGGTSFCQDS